MPLTAEVFLGARLLRALLFICAPLHLSCKSLTANRVRGRKSVVLLAQKFNLRKSRRTRRLRFAVILRRQQCSGDALGIVFSFFGASSGLPLLINAPNSFAFFSPPVRRNGKKQKAWFLLFQKIFLSLFLSSRRKKKPKKRLCRSSFPAQNGERGKARQQPYSPSFRIFPIITEKRKIDKHFNVFIFFFVDQT